MKLVLAIVALVVAVGTDGTAQAGPKGGARPGDVAICPSFRV